MELKHQVYTQIDGIEENYKIMYLDNVIEKVTKAKTEKIISLARREKSEQMKYQLEIVELYCPDDEFKYMSSRLGVYSTAVLHGTYKKRLTVINLEPTPFQEYNLNKMFPISLRDFLLEKEKNTDEFVYNQATDSEWKYSYKRYPGFKGCVTSCWYPVRIGESNSK